MRLKLNRASSIFNILTCIAGVVLAIGVSTAFQACAQKEDGTWMQCHEAQLVICALAVGIEVQALVRLFISRRAIQAALGVLIIIAAVFALFVPGTIYGMCMMDTMRCHAVMAPFTLVMGVLIIVFAIAGFFGKAQR